MSLHLRSGVIFFPSPGPHFIAHKELRKSARVVFLLQLVLGMRRAFPVRANPCESPRRVFHASRTYGFSWSVFDDGRARHSFPVFCPLFIQRNVFVPSRPVGIIVLSKFLANGFRPDKAPECPVIRIEGPSRER